MRIRSANCTWISNSAVNRIPCTQSCGSWFTDPDPDPAFQVNPDTDPDPIRIQGLMTKNWKKKNTAEIFLYLFLIKNGNLLMSRQKEKPSALKKENIHHFKKWNLLTFFCNCGSLLPSWIQDTDTGTPLNPNPDPQHCLYWYICIFFNAGSDSPKKLGGVEKGPAPNPPLGGGGGGEAQLKYENDRLKLALAQSSANAKVSALHDTVHHWGLPSALKGWRDSFLFSNLLHKRYLLWSAGGTVDTLEIESYYGPKDSVEDPEPGSCAFLTPGSGIQIRDPGWTSKIIFPRA
jgi:hypothetical protein